MKPRYRDVLINIAILLIIAVVYMAAFSPVVLAVVDSACRAPKYEGDGGEKSVALEIACLTGAEQICVLTDRLESEGIQCSLFMYGDIIRKTPSLIERIDAIGCEAGVYGDSSPDCFALIRRYSEPAYLLYMPEHILETIPCFDTDIRIVYSTVEMDRIAAGDALDAYLLAADIANAFVLFRYNGKNMDDLEKTIKKITEKGYNIKCVGDML